MFAFALLFMADAVTEAVARYRATTATDVRCGGATSDSDVAVCARRDGSRFRIPPPPPEPGTPAARTVPEERAALVRRGTPCREHLYSLTGCGAAGVGVTSSFGPGAKSRARFTPPPGSD